MYASKWTEREKIRKIKASLRHMKSIFSEHFLRLGNKMQKKFMQESKMVKWIYLFWARTKKTLKQYLKVMQDSRYLLSSILLSRKTHNSKTVKDTRCPRELFTLASQEHSFLNLEFWAKFDHSFQTLWYNLSYEWSINQIGQ